MSILRIRPDLRVSVTTVTMNWKRVFKNLISETLGLTTQAGREIVEDALTHRLSVTEYEKAKLEFQLECALSIGGQRIGLI